MLDNLKNKITGHITIKDKTTGEILVSKQNAIHYENMSLALAKSLSHRSDGHIHTMWFGNGGSTVYGPGQISYNAPRNTGASTDLYNPTYFKYIDDNSPLNVDPDKNNIVVKHTAEALYTDIIITATLGFGEPADQAAFDDVTDMEAEYAFDELGLKTFASDPSNGMLITHVIFHPIVKSLNRIIEVVYVIRIQMN